MTDKEYSEWCGLHMRLFAMTVERVAPTLSEWRPVFESAGWTAEELTAASRAIAAKPPAFLDKHLPALIDAMRSARALEYRRVTETAEDPRGTCATCSGAGVVIVPHPAFVAHGEWVYLQRGEGKASSLTCAVYCHCALGNAFVTRFETSQQQAGPEKKPRRRTMTLMEYSWVNPRWKEQMAQRDAENRELYLAVNRMRSRTQKAG